jgi:hypothetical protein
MTIYNHRDRDDMLRPLLEALQQQSGPLDVRGFALWCGGQVQALHQICPLLLLAARADPSDAKSLAELQTRYSNLAATAGWMGLKNHSPAAAAFLSVWSSLHADPLEGALRAAGYARRAFAHRAQHTPEDDSLTGAPAVEAEAVAWGDQLDYLDRLIGP